jgi:TolB-like protein/DNA-binding winged helix-turn-helix (wHTH) protein/cytochrome c-type biogenesis protein CcmH/NrfG
MSKSYRFGQFVLDPGRRTLSRADSPVSLTPKAFDVLLFLAQNPNRLVTKEELLQAVWGDTFVEEGNLAQYVWHLRKALGDDSENPRLIVTIARKGYQFTENVRVAEAADTVKQAAVQVPTAESSLAGTDAHIETRGDKAISKATKSWAMLAFMAASALILVAAAYASWRHFAGATPPRFQKIMLAVMPFENLTGDPDKQYLADGLTEETISQLSRLNPEQLGVIARTSVMGYKHKDVRLDQIGRDLSVQYVLKNSLRTSGNHLRLTAQLIQVKNQTPLWSRDYDYSAKDILNVERELAMGVADKFQLRLTSQRQGDLARARPVNAGAYDAFMKGYYFFQRGADDKVTNMAATYFERATHLDPSYAPAWVGLSRARYWQANVGLVPTQEGQQLARDAVERALTLDPNLPEANIQMGRIKRQVDFDWAGADFSIQRAIALEPGVPENLGQAAFMAELFGRFGEALALDRQALELDPLNAESWEYLAENRFYAGQLDEAVADIRKALELNADTWESPILLSEIYLLQGRPQDALRESERIPFAAFHIRASAMAYHALGREKESDATLRELIEKFHANAAWSIATVYALRNQRDEAFEWLDRAYTQHDGGLIFIKIDPLLKNLHNDPRYTALLEKLHLPT